MIYNPPKTQLIIHMTHLTNDVKYLKKRRNRVNKKKIKISFYPIFVLKCRK